MTRFLLAVLLYSESLALFLLLSCCFKCNIFGVIHWFICPSWTGFPPPLLDFSVSYLLLLSVHISICLEHILLNTQHPKIKESQETNVFSAWFAPPASTHQDLSLSE